MFVAFVLMIEQQVVMRRMPTANLDLRRNTSSMYASREATGRGVYPAPFRLSTPQISRTGILLGLCPPSSWR